MKKLLVLLTLTFCFSTIKPFSLEKVSQTLSSHASSIINHRWFAPAIIGLSAGCFIGYLAGIFRARKSNAQLRAKVESEFFEGIQQQVTDIRQEAADARNKVDNLAKFEELEHTDTEKRLGALAHLDLELVCYEEE